MKAISIYNPWAELMACEAKRNETRSWATSYRGPLAICSARTWNSDCQLALERSETQDALPIPAYRAAAGYKHTRKEDLRFGVILCVVEVYGCLSTNFVRVGWLEDDAPNDALVVSEQEFAFGNYEPDRFAWLTRNCRRLPVPVPVTGRQGLFNLTGETLAKVMEQI